MAKARAHPIVLVSYGSPGLVQFNARMLATLHHRLKCYATATGRSMGDCVNAAIADFLGRHEKATADDQE